MVRDADAEKQLVDRMLRLMENRAEQELLSKNIKQLGIPDASQRIAAEAELILAEQ